MLQREPYYKLQLGPVVPLELPIYSLRWRCITFIETTWDRFTAAEEINDLYASGADGLFVPVNDEGFWPEQELGKRASKNRLALFPGIGYNPPHATQNIGGVWSIYMRPS